MTSRKKKWLLGASAVFVGLVGYFFWLGYVIVGPWERNIAAGNAAYQQRNFTEAEKQYAAAIIEAEGFGPEEPRLATSLNNMALLYSAQGRYAEAEPLYTDMHRVHHSVVVAETNSNFGFNLPWWYRLFDTYRAQPAAGHAAHHGHPGPTARKPPKS